MDIKEYQDIEHALKELYPFSNEQMLAFMQRLSFRALAKGETLIKPGQVCSFIAFVRKGGLRSYMIQGGDEKTLHFFSEGMWVADHDSFVSQQKALNWIEALEHSEVAMITLKDIHGLLREYPVFHIMGKVMRTWTSTMHVELSQKSPDERYQFLLAMHPDWLNRFPLKYIASYLGMSPETLSRVRSRLTS